MCKEVGRGGEAGGGRGKEEVFVSSAVIMDKRE